MNGVNGRKNETQLLMVLACGATVEQASRECGLTDRTIYRRLKDPAFRAQISDMRREMVKRAAGAMAAAAMESVKTLLDLQKQNYPPPVRLGAARSILEIGLKMREVTDIEEELRQVREMLGHAQANGAGVILEVGPAANNANYSGLLRGPPHLPSENTDTTGETTDGSGEAAPNAG